MKTEMLVLIWLAAGNLSAQPMAVHSDADRQIFREYLHAIEPYRNTRRETLLEKTALFFMEKPYMSHTLEGGHKEQLTANLQAFDCTTFVETVIALTLTAAADAPSFNTFLDELQALRYRDGVIAGYASRLHYATDWLFENEQRDLLHNISASLGGVRQEKPLRFMSAHRDAYIRLKEDDAMLTRIIDMEDRISRRGGFYYLPKELIGVREKDIPHMSVVLFTTDIAGLDVTHMGFSFKRGEELTFLHASSAAMKVVADEQTISEYAREQGSCTGIVVSVINPAYSK